MIVFNLFLTDQPQVHDLVTCSVVFPEACLSLTEFLLIVALSLPLYISISLLSLPLSAPLSLHRSLPASASLSLSFALSLTLYIYLALSLYLYLSRSLSLYVSLYISLSISISLSLALSLALSLSLSLTLCLSFSLFSPKFSFSSVLLPFPMPLLVVRLRCLFVGLLLQKCRCHIILSSIIIFDLSLFFDLFALFCPGVLSSVFCRGYTCSSDPFKHLAASIVFSI